MLLVIFNKSAASGPDIQVDVACTYPDVMTYEDEVRNGNQKCIFYKV